MQFTLENVIKNLMSIYDNIIVQDSNLKESKIHDKKLEIILEKFKNYFLEDVESASNYLKLLQIEYFLLTGFSDILQEDYDMEAFYNIYDNLEDDVDIFNVYFWESDYLKIILDIIIENYRDTRFYDYTLFRAALNDRKTAKVIEKLHVNLEEDKKIAKKQFSLDKKAAGFIDIDLEYPMEFFLYLKYFYKNYKSKEIVKEYAKEKLRVLQENNFMVYKNILVVLMKFYYYYASNYQFSFQKTNSINNVEAMDLLDIISTAPSKDYLLFQAGIDYYLDLLLDSVFIYTTNGYNSLEASLTKEQRKVLEKLG